MKKLIFVISVFCVVQLSAQITSSTVSVADNTIYSYNVDYSNGAGNTMVTGCRDCINNRLRRALVKFSPSFECTGSVNIISAELSLWVKNIPTGGYLNDSVPVYIHLLTKDWGEESSVANRPGIGVQAEEGDATWEYNFYNSETWSNDGGDYLATASDFAYVHDDASPPYELEFTGSGIVSDVQGWTDGTYNNYGWIIIGDESQNYTGVPFYTKESNISIYHPRLIITYTCSDSDLKSGEPVTEIIQGDVLYAESISVYPNPAGDILNISLNADTESQIYLYNVLGILLKTETVTATTAKIDISMLSPGSYTVVMQNELGSFTKQIIKK